MASFARVSNRRESADIKHRWSVLGPLYFLIAFSVALPATAKNIFEDDWTPPSPRKPESPPPVIPSPLTHPPVSPPIASSQPTLLVPTTSPANPIVAKSEPASPGNALTTNAATSATITVTHRAIPAKSDQAQSRKLLAQVYSADMNDKSNGGRTALARKLMQAAGKSAEIPSDQFVMLMGASAAAREGFNLSLSFQAIDALASAFDIDELAFKSNAVLAMAGRAATPAADLVNCRDGIAIVDELLAQDDFITATRVLAILRPLAVSDAATLQQLQTLGKQVDFLQTEGNIAARSQEKLKAAPDDPVANMVMGRFLVVVKGDWERALPLLAKASSAPVKAAAAADILHPTAATDQVDVADRWWEAAAKEANAPLKFSEQKRAAYWYETASAEVQGLRKTQVDKRLAELRVISPPGVVLSHANVAKPFTVTATAKWMLVDFTVMQGKCYRIVAKGQWKDSRGNSCGPEGVCPAESFAILGAQPKMSKEQRDEWYLGQHPRSALLARVGEEKIGFYVGPERAFIAPATGKLSFRINDGDADSNDRSGSMNITFAETQPRWTDAQGSIEILARIDDVDMLHFTPAGIYWEWGGHWGKVGEHDGHYPTVINGVYWWPHWSEKLKSDPLESPDLRLKGHIHLVRVEAKRGEVKLDDSSPTDVLLRFKDFGGGSSQVGCVIQISK